MSRSSNRSFSYTDNKNNRSFQMESDLVTMQREIDSYTRKLELEKKLNLKSSYQSQQYLLNLLNCKIDVYIQQQENDERKDKIKEMKKIQENSKNKQAACHMVTLKKAIDHYEKRKVNSLDGIQKIKMEIEDLRRQRMSCLEQIKNIEQEIINSHTQAEQLYEDVERKAHKSVMNQQQMYELRQKNDMDKEVFQKELDSLQVNKVNINKRQNKVREAQKREIKQKYEFTQQS